MRRDLFDLSEKTALITGGSRGLGLQIAEALCDYGANVILVARNKRELSEAAAALAGRGGEVATIVADLQDLSAIKDLVATATGKFGTIDLLVNNAGMSLYAPAEDYTLDAWNEVMTLNMTAPFLLTGEVGKQQFIPRRTGKVLNIASIGGLFGNRPDFGMKIIAYNSSKGAMVNYTRALAAEWGVYNINVNALCPGFFPSQMSQGFIDQVSTILLPSVPLGRVGGPDDLKGPALLLLSEAGRHITGQCLVVDGGMVAV
jgi:gluconate 5-dehydrogenase